MKNKLWSIILLVVTLILGSVALVACDDDHVHTMQHHTAQSATCTVAGNPEYWSCDGCGKNFSDEAGKTEISSVVISATGHTEIVDAEVAATCKKAGLTEGKHCSVCNEVLIAQKEVPALDHDLGEDGVCSRCGENKELPHEHVFGEWTQTLPAT